MIMGMTIGDSSYLLSIFLLVVSLFCMWYILKGLEKEKIKKVLIILAFANFALHFLKILIPPYSSILFDKPNTWPYSIANLTFENICAVNTIFLPFALISKKQWFRDGVLCLSCIGGLLAILLPIDMITYTSTYILEIIRYYLCHYFLFIIPFLILVFKVYRLDFNSFWKVPLYFILVEFIILLNNYLLMEIGVLRFREEFLEFEWKNSAMIYGPYIDGVDPIHIAFLDAVVPSFMKTVPEGFPAYNEFAGQIKYWPVLWMIGPLLVYVYPISFVLFSLIDKKGFQEFISKVKKVFKHA